MIFAKSKVWQLLWIAGAWGLVVFFFTVVFLRSRPGPATQITLKAQRLELVQAVRIALASVSEAQNSAVMSNADEDTRYFVAQARSASTDLDRELQELENALTAHADQQQLELLGRVKQALLEFQRLDKELLELAAQSSNRKAYSLAFGPAAKVLQELEGALSQIVTDHADSTSASNQQIAQLANETRIGVLHIQVLLLPHIAEERGEKMDAFEAEIAQEDQKVIESLDSLSALLQSSDVSEIVKAKALYAEFNELRSQIIKLSRENTNVRSLSLALNEKRKAMLAVEDSLAALAHAIQSEEVVTTIPLRR